MSLPYELELNIISFVPEFNMGLVCKIWKKKIDTIRKTAVNAIGKWYRPRRITENWNNVHDLVRHMIVHYPDEFFLPYPEFTVGKLRLNEELLLILPPIQRRKRSDVRNWMLNIPIELDDWFYVGL